MLIKDARFVLTPEGLQENKSIEISENRIKSLDGEDKSGKIIDASGYAVLPGLVNMHTHASMNLFRGVSDDKKLQEWLQEDIWPLEEKLDGEKCYWGALHAFLEMIKTGTTCFNDMYFYMDQVAEAAEKIGIRGFLGHGMIDLGDQDKADKELQEAKRIVNELKGSSDLVEPAVTPHSCETCSEELLLRSKELADKNDALLHIHLAETGKEIEEVKKRGYGGSVEYLNKLGLLDERFIGAHAVHLNKKEIKILKNSGGSVVYNPCSNMKLASGVSPVIEMMKRGVNVCLGTDSVTSNNNLDLFEEMKIATLLQKVRSSDPTVMPAEETVKTVGENAGRALNKKIGLIEEGYLADLILIDLDDIRMKPTHNLISNLVYSGASVDTSIVNGEVVMENQEVKTIDERKVQKKVEEIARELTS
ncbi:MAG: amidohydrolase [Candidatus Aenigmatarchaeota archaeon]